MCQIFYTASSDDIKAGKVSDVYFKRGVEILKQKGWDKKVKGEVRASSLPDNWSWAVLAGLEETVTLFEGVNVSIESIPEGTVFHAGEPVLTIEGNYTDFAVYETSLLGLLCQATGISTKAARCKIAASGRSIYSFGARRMHPAITPMIERSAFIGGCDGVAVGKSAELIGEKPIGTMAHALILTIGDEAKAFKAFNEIIESSVKRVALIDTLEDEKFAAIKAAEALGDDLFAVRLDTPSSRRGNFLKIMEEVRWELDLRGYKHVKIFASGGLDEYQIREYNAFADAYGVGTVISNAPVVDFSFDLVEVEDKPVAKRGKKSGSKRVLRCKKCFRTYVHPATEKTTNCKCKGELEDLLSAYIEQGKVVGKSPKPQEIRNYVLEQLKHLELEATEQT